MTMTYGQAQQYIRPGMDIAFQPQVRRGNQQLAGLYATLAELRKNNRRGAANARQSIQQMEAQRAMADVAPHFAQDDGMGATLHARAARRGISRGLGQDLQPLGHPLAYGGNISAGMIAREPPAATTQSLLPDVSGAGTQLDATHQQWLAAREAEVANLLANGWGRSGLRNEQGKPRTREQALAWMMNNAGGFPSHTRGTNAAIQSRFAQAYDAEGNVVDPELAAKHQRWQQWQDERRYQQQLGTIPRSERQFMVTQRAQGQRPNQVIAKAAVGDRPMTPFEQAYLQTRMLNSMDPSVAVANQELAGQMSMYNMLQNPEYQRSRAAEFYLGNPNADPNLAGRLLTEGTGAGGMPTGGSDFQSYTPDSAGSGGRYIDGLRSKMQGQFDSGITPSDADVAVERVISDNPDDYDAAHQDLTDMGFHPMQATVMLAPFAKEMSGRNLQKSASYRRKREDVDRTYGKKGFWDYVGQASNPGFVPTY
jgi:hypothetical protein